MAPAEIGEVTAVDLSRIRPRDLHRNPGPISAWPTAQIRLEETHHETCIASWRRDVESIHAVSDRLSSCRYTLAFDDADHHDLEGTR